jgi:hypothetical protein
LNFKQRAHAKKLSEQACGANWNRGRAAP